MGRGACASLPRKCSRAACVRKIRGGGGAGEICARQLENRQPPPPGNVRARRASENVLGAPLPPTIPPRTPAPPHPHPRTPSPLPPTVRQPFAFARPPPPQTFPNEDPLKDNTSVNTGLPPPLMGERLVIRAGELAQSGCCGAQSGTAIPSLYPLPPETFLDVASTIPFLKSQGCSFWGRCRGNTPGMSNCKGC